MIINKYTKLNDNEYLETLKEEQEEEQEEEIDNKNEIKRCVDFQKKTYETLKTTMYNEGKKIKKK